jgi:hypothetical protein
MPALLLIADARHAHSVQNEINMDQESFVFDVAPLLPRGHQPSYAAVEGWENGTVGAGERMQKSLKRMADMLPQAQSKGW